MRACLVEAQNYFVGSDFQTIIPSSPVCNVTTIHTSVNVVKNVIYILHNTTVTRFSKFYSQKIVFKNNKIKRNI